MIGESRSAYEQMEMAWSRRSGSESDHPASMATRCVDFALDAGNLQLAQQWLEVAESEAMKTPCRNCDKLVARAVVDVLRFSGTEYDGLRSAYRRYVDRSTRVKTGTHLDATIVRVELLNTKGGDPRDGSHSARRQMLIKSPGLRGVRSLFSRSLISSDFHLASLRYCIGMDAVDDEYYTTPQTVPLHCVGMDWESFHDRFRRARLAVERTIRHARTLDDWLECDRWEKLVESRRGRLEEIVAAVS